MSKALLSIKTDNQTKQDLKAFAAELGISSTAFVNIVIRQALRDRRLVLSTALEPTPYLVKIMEEVEEDLKTGRNMSPVFTSAKDMFEHLEQNK